MSEQPDNGHGPCVKCVFFRRARLASQILATEFQANADGAEVASAIGKIVDDEQKLREAEADLKSKQDSANSDLWLSRPMTADFCGLQEADEIYRIREIKNRGGVKCGDFEAGKPERHACEDCAHRVPAEGRKADYERELTYTRLITNAVAVRSSASSAEGMLSAYRSGETSRKALEISAAYNSKGRLMTKPEYLDHCGALSTEDEYVVCALQNAHHTCSEWEPISTPGGD